MLPDEPTDEERQEELPQDNATPFQPAASPQGNPATQDDQDRVNQTAGIDDTHPATDTNMQPEEQYDEGVSGAAEAQEPNAGNAVTGFSSAGQPQDRPADAPADNTGTDGQNDQTGNSGEVITG